MSCSYIESCSNGIVSSSGFEEDVRKGGRVEPVPAGKAGKTEGGAEVGDCDKPSWGNIEGSSWRSCKGGCI